MGLYQLFWQPNNHSMRITIRQRGNFAEVFMNNSLSSIVVIEGHGIDIVIDDIRPNPQPKKIEAARVYEGL